MRFYATLSASRFPSLSASNISDIKGSLSKSTLTKGRCGTLRLSVAHHRIMVVPLSAYSEHSATLAEPFTDEKGKSDNCSDKNDL